MKKSMVAFMVLFASAVALMGCSKKEPDHVKNSEAQQTTVSESITADSSLQNINVKNITLNTFVGDDGQMVESIEYEFDELPDLDQITPKDFTITLEKEIYKVLDMKTENHRLILKTEPFRFLGKNVYGKDMKSTHYDFSVDCTEDALDFDKSTDSTVQTKTADDFIKGKFTGSNGIELPYWLYMPENASNLPLMLWEHGGGEVLSTSFEGANIMNNRGAVTWIENGYDTAVLSFQFPENYEFGISENPEQLKMMQDYNDVIYECIQDLIKKGQIDASRVYISGASSGGGATLRFLMQYPDLFAAAFPICAKDTLIPISKPYNLAYKLEGSLEISEEEYQKCYEGTKSLMKENDITQVPIWFVQAENDPICTSYTSKILDQVLKEMGAKNNKLTLYTDEEMKAAGQTIYHSSWVLALKDKEMMDWIYSQNK
ncbi:prolyl oligopeptidase family serine peptidase [Clostridium sp. E02]|uniref:carboxylesterase family protein n=1 Tax=Clostridium sp. E02 TaxID=2487134 RepID=UPI000F536DC0|nr:prolyl oligopeptidase family serine peptidase [Clostridium sp. E02]